MVTSSKTRMERVRTMDCREVLEYLPAYDDQSTGPRSSVVNEHLAGCGGCRAELEEYREMAINLRSLSDETVEPPAWLLGTVIETVTERARKLDSIRAAAHRVTDPKVIAGGAILAAGLAGAMLMKGRRKRRRRSLREVLAQA